MQTVILACMGRQANAKLYQCLWIYPVPEALAEQVDGVFICDLYVFSASYSPLQLQGPHVCQSLPEGVSVFCFREQMPYAPELGSTARFFLSVSPIHSPHMTVTSEKRRDFPVVHKQLLYMSAHVLIKPLAIIILATSRLP